MIRSPQVPGWGGWSSDLTAQRGRTFTALGRFRPRTTAPRSCILSAPGLSRFRRVPRLLCDRDPGTKVVVLTTYADDRSVLDELLAGTRGYLTKDAGGPEIRQTLEHVLDNQGRDRSRRPAPSPDAITGGVLTPKSSRSAP